MSHTVCKKFEAASQILGKRWVGLIINQLINEPKRFNLLENEINISGKVLSERLKYLENEGIVQRNVYPDIPVRIEYTLTEKGRSLKPIMDEIGKWSQTWINQT
ncbi:MAG: winged helix-turn-helix transcriptional regulator [Acholeplasmataceae bacterium]